MSATKAEILELAKALPYDERWELVEELEATLHPPPPGPPMTEEEFQYVAKDLKPVVNPELVFIAEVKGKPVGFAMSLPDLNIIMKDNRKGHLLPFLIRLLLFKKRIDFIRIIILGVLPEYLHSGIGGVLFYETGRRSVEQGYPHGEASWVVEDNVMMTRGAQLMQGVRTKTYRVYDLLL